ncbi:hypothetical protein PCASD_11263 [Puccinia coronata f. sp. avenae]|uniref:Uncharacterized protein n=1 Tax=Puccinia coronata f. sp. avenae TaxID=200324 RepID=A0A2N5UJ24_9BASI|nr:hypothetical protein PCASD_11263 [Puccinia coronata f. sp. avenae]
MSAIAQFMFGILGSDDAAMLNVSNSSKLEESINLLAKRDGFDRSGGSLLSSGYLKSHFKYENNLATKLLNMQFLGSTARNCFLNLKDASQAGHCANVIMIIAKDASWLTGS